MAKKKDKKVTWAVINPETGILLYASTRGEARDIKLHKEKILRIEIKNGRPVASFVR